jgi:alkanesulfonate monooxygenase SsuD/methylene tetrahydromethanopterin reductase-like flavin-dependent oxidoreductase (luciferase family)
MVTSYNHGDWDRLMAGDYSRPPAVPDPVMMDNTLHMGELVEPLGFDSIWTTEHYGSAYSMQPNPLQWLAYWAGRTERVDVGTAVVVAPWWNPVRLAHEISMLDVLLKGRRLMLGLGRGVSEHEYASLGVPREKSREFFYEVVDVLRLADGNERFSYDGDVFKIPPTTIRPQARHKGRLLEGMRAAFTTRGSAELAAEAGLGQLFVAGEPLSAMSQQVAQSTRSGPRRAWSPTSPRRCCGCTAPRPRRRPSRATATTSTSRPMPTTTTSSGTPRGSRACGATRSTRRAPATAPISGPPDASVGHGRPGRAGG